MSFIKCASSGVFNLPLGQISTLLSSEYLQIICRKNCSNYTTTPLEFAQNFISTTPLKICFNYPPLEFAELHRLPPLKIWYTTTPPRICRICTKLHRLPPSKSAPTTPPPSNSTVSYASYTVLPPLDFISGYGSDCTLQILRRTREGLTQRDSEG